MGTIFHNDIPYTGLGTPNLWGAITGTLSHQHDLQTILDTKMDKTDKDEYTDLETQSGSEVVFDNLNPNYGYDIEFYNNTNDSSVIIPKWTNLKREPGTNTGTIKYTFTISGGTDGSSQFALRIKK